MVETGHLAGEGEAAGDPLSSGGAYRRGGDKGCLEGRSFPRSVTGHNAFLSKVHVWLAKHLALKPRPPAAAASRVARKSG